MDIRIKKCKWIGLLILVGILGPFLGTAIGEKKSNTSKQLRKISLGVGYIPNVQFAPLYVAQEKGFYAEEGLSVKIEYGFENDFVTLAALGKREFAVASGDQVILARSQGLPITYVMKWYERYPVAVMVPADKGIKEPKELINRKVGLPGFYGTSFIGWKALVYGAQIDESAVNVQEIGYTQAAAIQKGIVDAAVVYIANEPVQLRNLGIDIQVFEVSDYINLVSNGLVVGERLMANDPELVGKMVRASLKGLKFTIDNPEAAFLIVRKIIPEITDKDAPVQKQVLDVSIDLCRSKQMGLSNPKAWKDSIEFMENAGILKKAGNIRVESLFTNRFVELD